MRFPMSIKHLCSLAFLLIVSTAQAGDIDAYFVDTLWPGDGEPIKNAVIIVEGGKIQSVGAAAQVSVPAQAKRHILSGRTMMPALWQWKHRLALAVLTMNEMLHPSIVPSMRSIFTANMTSIYRPHNQCSYLTIEPTVTAGQTAMVKLGKGLPDSKRLLDSSGIKVVLSKSALNPPTVYEPPVGAVSIDRPLEPTRPQIGASYLEQVAGLAALLESSREQRVQQMRRMRDSKY